MFYKMKPRTILPVFCFVLFAASSLHAGLISRKEGGGANGTVIDFDSQQTSFGSTGPVQIGEGVGESVWWSATPVGYLAVDNAAFGNNYSWIFRGGIVASAIVPGGSVTMSFTFADGPVSSAGAFMNYSTGPYNGNSGSALVAIEALDSNGNVLESYNLLSVAPITATKVNDGGFRGIVRGNKDIATIRFVSDGRFFAVDDLVFSRIQPKKVAADFDGDGQADILLENVSSGDHKIWIMNGAVPAASLNLPVIVLDWRIVGTGDFNGDGQTDILWENVGSGDRGIWIMNGTVPAAWINLPSIALNWRIVGTGDFNGDGQTDILWENVGSGDRGMWIMNGTVPAAWINLPSIALNWRIVGTGDFNGDGQTDILWENVGSGDRGMWIMDGTVPAAWINLPSIALNWRIAGTGDFNGDGQTDILWENESSGDRGMWIMNRTVPAAWINLPTLALDWRIAQ